MQSPVESVEHESAIDSIEAVRRQLAGLSPEEERWADDACIYRHLSARGMDVTKATAQLKDTLVFRREQDVPNMRAEMFPSFLERGDLYVGGFAPGGEPVLMLRKRQNKLLPEEEEPYIRFLTWTFEQGVKAAASRGKERWVAVMDMKGYQSKNSPKLSVSLRVVNVLAHHYPERLKSLVIVDAPAVFWILWNAVSPFVDANTRAKVHFGSSKKHDATTGKLLSGGTDHSGLDEVWATYKEPYDCKAYLDFLRSIQDVSKEKHVEAADV